jgi:Domain of unknown function (DUF5658)
MLPMLLILTAHPWPAVAHADDSEISRTGHNPLAPAPAADSDIPNVERPAILIPLYATLAGVHGLDVMLTTRGLGGGCEEANPLLRSIAGRLGPMVAAKTASTIGTVYLAERLWKQNHRRQAIAALVISNGIVAAVAMHNARATAARQ